jgi:site-specific DNA-methyltransferase (adenine-specific)
MKPTWQSFDGRVQLYHGDCLKILPKLGQVDAVITDPPYGEKTHLGQRSTKKKSRGKGGHTTVDFHSVDAAYLRKIFSACCPKRWLVSFIEWQHCLPLEEQPPDGLEFIRMGVWVKLNPIPQLTGDRPGTGWEAIAIFHPPGKKLWNGGGRSATWNYGTSRHGNFGPSNHPTEKPLKLVQQFVLAFTDVKETILDPFMGSGTTGIACLRLNRRFIGIEIDEKYFEIAKKRIQDDLRKPSFFKQPEKKRKRPTLLME